MKNKELIRKDNKKEGRGMMGGIMDAIGMSANPKNVRKVETQEYSLVKYFELMLDSCKGTSNAIKEQIKDSLIEIFRDEDISKDDSIKKQFLEKVIIQVSNDQSTIRCMQIIRQIFSTYPIRSAQRTTIGKLLEDVVLVDTILDSASLYLAYVGSIIKGKRIEP